MLQCIARNRSCMQLHSLASRCTSMAFWSRGGCLMPSRCGTVWWKFSIYQSRMSPCCHQFVDYLPCESRCAAKWGVSAASNAEEAIASPGWGSGHAALRWYGLEPQQSRHGSPLEHPQTTWSCSNCTWWPQTGRPQTSAQIHRTQPCSSPRNALGCASMADLVAQWRTWQLGSEVWIDTDVEAQVELLDRMDPARRHARRALAGWLAFARVRPEDCLPKACRGCGTPSRCICASCHESFCRTCLDSPWRPACCEEDESGDCTPLRSASPAARTTWCPLIPAARQTGTIGSRFGWEPLCWLWAFYAAVIQDQPGPVVQGGLMRGGTLVTQLSHRRSTLSTESPRPMSMLGGRPTTCRKTRTSPSRFPLLRVPRQAGGHHLAAAWIAARAAQTSDLMHAAAAVIESSPPRRRRDHVAAVRAPVRSWAVSKRRGLRLQPNKQESPEALIRKAEVLGETLQRFGALRPHGFLSKELEAEWGQSCLRLGQRLVTGSEPVTVSNCAENIQWTGSFHG